MSSLLKGHNLGSFFGALVVVKILMAIYEAIFGRVVREKMSNPDMFFILFLMVIFIVLIVIFRRMIKRHEKEF